MRTLLGTLFACLLAWSTAGWADGGLHVRVMAGNLTSGNDQSYDPGDGVRIFQALQPQVVMIQEFNYADNSPEAIRQFVNSAFGRNFYYYRENDPTDQIPNGVISQFPILDAGQWHDPYMPNRDFVYAKLDIPGPHKLWVVSVHFSNKLSKNRVNEADIVTKALKRNVPPGDYIVVGGDLNTRNGGEEALRRLSEVVSSTRVPTDSDKNVDTSSNRSKHYDWVLASPNLERHQVAVDFSVDGEEDQPGYNVYPDGLVFDTRTFPLLNRLEPARQGDSDAANMQHMAVIKDFEIPANDDGAAEVQARPVPVREVVPKTQEGDACRDAFSALNKRRQIRGRA